MLEVQVHNTETEEVPEQRLWRAVLANTVQKWISDLPRKKREAEQFLFEDNEDYRTVCCSAGIDPAHFRNRLEKLRTGSNLQALNLVDLAPQCKWDRTVAFLRIDASAF